MQSSNAREIARAALVHGVGSRAQAEALAAKAERPLPVLLQVSLWGEPSKNGFTEAELKAELPVLREVTRLRVVGLMAMPPAGAGGMGESRVAFAAVREARRRAR